MITASKVKELRDKSGAGMMDAKKALTETNGDMEKAMDYLREKGITTADKKSSRIAADGLVATKISEDGKKGAVIEVNAETDFVAKNDSFVKFVDALTELILKESPADVEELKTLSLGDMTVEEKLIDLIATIGENMNIRRFETIESEGQVVSYVHGNGAIGVLIDLAKGDKEVGENVALQVAAMDPEYLNPDEIPEDVIEKEKSIAREQLRNEGKPENILDKILVGKMNKYYEEICLLNQKYVKDSDKTITQYLKENDAEVTGYVRMAKGEGLEKREENFAEEVAKQMKGEF